MSQKHLSSVYSTQKSARLENAAKGGVKDNLGQVMEDENSEPANDIKALKGQLSISLRYN